MTAELYDHILIEFSEPSTNAHTLAAVIHTYAALRELVRAPLMCRTPPRITGVWTCPLPPQYPPPGVSCGLFCSCQYRSLRSRRSFGRGVRSVAIVDHPPARCFVGGLVPPSSVGRTPSAGRTPSPARSLDGADARADALVVIGFDIISGLYLFSTVKV